MYRRIFFLIGIFLSVGVLLGYGREVLAFRSQLEVPESVFVSPEDVNFIEVTEKLKLLPPEGAALEDGRYGRSVLLDGDTLFVGQTQGETNNIPGRVYIYERHFGGPNNWGLTKIITPSEGAGRDSFGNSLSIDGDTLLVGAAVADGNANESGAAYIFERNAGGPDNWGQVAKLIAADGAYEDRFAWTADISGDTVVVGARWDDNSNGSEAGAVYVFERNAGGPNNWGQVRRVLASDGAALDRFGLAVAIAGDTIVAGADGQDNNGSQSGSVYVLERNAGGSNNWGEVAQFYPDQPAANDLFGIYVDIEGDMAAVGGQQTSPNPGAVYLFDRNAGGANNWGQIAQLTPSDGAAGDRFGVSFSLVEGKLIIGARHGDGVEANSGTAYLFEPDDASPGEWIETSKLVASDGETNDWFGWNVSMFGEVVVVGAYYNDDLCPADPNCDSGSAYLFYPDLVADVVIEKTVSDVTAVPGQPLTYALTFTNNGPDIAFGTVITDLVPDVILNPTFTSSGATITPTGGLPFVWQVDNLAPGTGGLITVTGIISPELVNETTIVNTAVIANSADITPTNNSSTAVTQVIIPQINLSASEYVVDEDGGQVMVTAVLSPAQPFLDVSVDYETANGTAVTGEDYTAVTGILTFTAGMTQAHILVPMLDDQLVEPDETFTLALSNPVHAVLGSVATATVTISDDDGYPELNLSAAEYMVLENDGQATLTVTLSHPYPEPVSVVYETADGTAVAGEDYTVVSGILTFTAGMTEASIFVPILDDQLVEPVETFALELSNPIHATLGDVVTATITILDDDTYPELNLSAPDYTVLESDGQAQLTVNLSHPYPESVNVSYQTTDGTAVDGEDYTAVSAILTFTAGTTEAQIFVPILDDQLVEGSETFTVTLSDPVHAALGSLTEATVLIMDDDSFPSVSLSSEQSVVTEDAGEAILTVTLSHDYAEPVSMTYETADGTAVAGSDYTESLGILTFAPGVTQTTFTVPITDDLQVEGSETFSLSLANFVNTMPGLPISATVTIVDNDEETPPPTMSYLYLPIILRPAPTPPPQPFPIWVSAGVAPRPIASEGEIFYTANIPVPADLPPTGQFFFSAAADELNAISVDDELAVILNGEEVFVKRFSTNGQTINPEIVPLPRQTMVLMAGQTVTVVFRDVFGDQVSATPVWIVYIP